MLEITFALEKWMTGGHFFGFWPVVAAFDIDSYSNLVSPDICSYNQSPNRVVVQVS